MILCPSNQWSEFAFVGSLKFLVATEIVRRQYMNAESKPRLSTRTEAVERDVMKALLDEIIPAGCA